MAYEPHLPAWGTAQIKQYACPQAPRYYLKQHDSISKTQRFFVFG
jgi:hypothetical protein